ncbi:hypothetical protein ABZT08_02425 [Streptomyces sp. NPDC005526]
MPSGAYAAGRPLLRAEAVRDTRTHPKAPGRPTRDRRPARAEEGKRG